MSLTHHTQHAEGVFGAPPHQLQQGSMWKEKGPCCGTGGEAVAEAESLDVLNLLPKVVQVPNSAALVFGATYRHQ